MAAPHPPIVPPELFETALAIRAEKGRESPNRTGRPRHYSRNQDGKVYPLSHIAVCGASVTSHYTYHQAGGHRKKESCIHYYACARQVKGLHLAEHRNRVLASRAEERILNGVQHLFETPEIVQQAMVKARNRAEVSLSPKKKQAADVTKSLQANKEAVERLVATMTPGIFEGAAVEILQDQATQLKRERDRLEREHRQLTAELVTLTENFDSEAFQAALSNFARLAEKAEPDELRRLLRLLIARIEWLPDGEPARVHFYHMPKSPPSIEGGDWFATARQKDSPLRRNVALELLRLPIVNGVPEPQGAVILRAA